MVMGQMVKSFAKGAIKISAIMGIVCSGFMFKAYAGSSHNQYNSGIAITQASQEGKEWQTFDFSKIPTLNKTLQINKEVNKNWLNAIVTPDNVKTPRLAMKKAPLFNGCKVVVMSKIWQI